MTFATASLLAWISYLLNEPPESRALDPAYCFFPTGAPASTVTGVGGVGATPASAAFVVVGPGFGLVCAPDVAVPPVAATEVAPVGAAVALGGASARVTEADAGAPLAVLAGSSGFKMTRN